jgi:hypothetical protein
MNFLKAKKKIFFSYFLFALMINVTVFASNLNEHVTATDYFEEHQLENLQRQLMKSIRQIDHFLARKNLKQQKKFVFKKFAKPMNEKENMSDSTNYLSKRNAYRNFSKSLYSRLLNKLSMNG